MIADFTIRAEEGHRDAERIRNWISARKNKRIVYLGLAIDDMRQYKSLCRDLSGITYDVLGLYFTVGMDSFAMPPDIKVRHFILTSMRCFTLRPSQLSKSLIDSLEVLDMTNVSFKKFKSVNRSQYSFSKLKVFALDCDGSSQQGLHTMKNFLALMPALKEFKISCDDSANDDEKCIAPLVSFPTSLNTVTGFICDNVHADLSHCKWPNLEELRLYNAPRLGQWTGLTDKLRVVEIYNSYIGEEYDICKRDTLDKLKNVTLFALGNIQLTPVYRLFNEGFFDDAMPNLEMLNVVSVETEVKADAIKRFIERHPLIDTVFVEESEELLNMTLPRDVEVFMKQTPRGGFFDDALGDLIHDVYGDAFNSDGFDYGMEDDYEDFDEWTDYDSYGEYDDDV